ncbi:F0F1 ATP synthase subunit B [Pleomorphomonas oryzae]|uniref:F0F1 ATP synthase subunit B n=1 Tax=Pleomorphomonas oryzae TaxID=261934 RepID=UPI000415B26E|nr:F0F1 ATP synthase subunit B [Pleomorphomonas oryzae]
MSWFISQANAQQPAVVPAEGGHAPTEATGTTVAHGGGEHGGTFPPFDPSTFPSQLFWLAIVFIALYVLMAKKVIPQISDILEARAAKIASELVEAERAKAETDTAIASYEASLAAARNKANAIAHETRSKVAHEIDGRRHAAEAQLAAKLADTEQHIADVKKIALDHVSAIATETTEAVVEALVGKVGRDEVTAAVAAVSVGKH